jgi:N-methylhydantoinase A
VCEELGTRDIIASDMGGTSFDVGIIKHGEPLAADSTLLGKFRYRVPALEVVSIGAGGGSIAWIDRHGGGLRVGPESAGSLPGPACYGRGGTQPTVTDADLVLGYISPDATFGSGDGGFRPKLELAEQAIKEHIADPLGLSVTDAALGIVEVTNAKMANALENEIIGRGFDPRDFVLMSYGGAGPFHAVGYTESLGIDTIVVPGEAASVWSAFGISQADIRYQYEASVAMLEPFSADGIQRAIEELEADARAELSEREDVDQFEFRRYARIRFQWQLHELEMRLPDGAITDDRVGEIARQFVAMYAERYGEAALLPGARLQIDSLRLEPAIAMGSARLDRLEVDGRPFRRGTRELYFERGAGPVETDVFNGESMPVGEPVEGPAVIDLAITGIVLPPGTSCERRQTGDFVLKLG